MSSVIGPKDKATAVGLLDAAASLGHPASVVRSVLEGFDVPDDVADRFYGRDTKPEPKPQAPRKRAARKSADNNTDPA